MKHSSNSRETPGLGLPGLMAIGALLCAPYPVVAQAAPPAAAPNPVTVKPAKPAKAAPTKVLTSRYTPSQPKSPQANSCLRLTAMPSRLVGSPGGIAIIQMQRALSSVSERVGSEAGNPEALRKVAVLRNDLDSAMRISVGSTDAGTGNVMIRLRGQSAGEGQLRPPSDADRARLDQMLRELQPRVADLARSENVVTGTLNIRSNALGYVGVTATAGTFPMSVDVSKPFAYCEYPRVESVEPGSPAEKAGLMAGDTLLAYNGRDLRAYDVNYPVLLVPGKALRIRFRRDGRVREVVTTVEPRPAEPREFVVERFTCSDTESRGSCDTNMPAGFRATAFPRGTNVMVHGRPSVPFLYSIANGEMILGGASLRAIDAAFAQNTGLEAGLLVNTVPVNSAAFEAGLRGGEVIISASGSAVRDMASLYNALLPRITERAIALQVSNRTSGVRTVTFRW